MTVEEARTSLRTQLEELLGVAEASILLDRPPGGWGDLATNQALAALEARLDRRFVELEANLDVRMRSAIDRAFTSQLRWLVGSMTGLLAVVVAAVKL
jgi:hypothetical protein